MAPHIYAGVEDAHYYTGAERPGGRREGFELTSLDVPVICTGKATPFPTREPGHRTWHTVLAGTSSRTFGTQTMCSGIPLMRPTGTYGRGSACSSAKLAQHTYLLQFFRCSVQCARMENIQRGCPYVRYG